MAALAAPLPARADAVADFYRGQSITLLVGANTGGGYDAYARPVSRHLGRFIPGEPNIVVKYMPAAASSRPPTRSIRCRRTTGSRSAWCSAMSRSSSCAATPTPRYDPFKFIWLGSLASETSVTLVWSSAPHRSAQDLLKLPLIAGSLGPQTDSEIESNAMIALLGAPIKLVRGYTGTADTLLAVERGELQGVHGISWSYIKSRKADWLKEGKIRVLLQTGLTPHPDLKDVATMFDLVKTEELRQIWELIFTPKQIRGRSCCRPRCRQSAPPRCARRSSGWR